MAPTKNEIASTYSEAMKLAHGGKPMPLDRSAVVIGDNLESNIGAGITARLVSDEFIVWSENLLTCDMSDAWTAEQYFKKCDADTLVLCNGETHLDWIEDQPASRIAKVIDNTLLASIYAVRGFVKASLAKPYRKHIVFIGSMAYRSVLNGSAPYCAAKAGLAHFARCCAWELAPKAYDVFILHPSNTEGTPMTDETIKGLMRYRNLKREEAEAYWAAGKLREEWLQPSDIAHLVSVCVSGRVPYLSGAQLDLNGGGR